MIRYPDDFDVTRLFIPPDKWMMVWCGRLGIRPRLCRRTSTTGVWEVIEVRKRSQAQRDEAHEQLDSDMGWDW